MNLLDSAIGWISPETALRRWQARQLLDAARGYDAAQNGRRTASFRRGEGSANATISRALPVLRERSRELVRNTFIGARALDIHATHVVSADLTVRFTGKGPAVRQAQALWDEWVKVCDIEGETGFTGLLSLLVRSSYEGGDALLRMLDRPLGDNQRPVPLALHAGEGDLIDEGRDTGSLLSGAAHARLGVELGAFDERLGYWLHRVAPGEPQRLGNALQPSVLVPREQVCHLYRRIRPGQVRGVPLFAPVLMAARDFSDVMDALVVKARLEASIGAFIKSNDGATSMGAAIAGKGPDAPTRLEQIRPGMVQYLRQGEELQAFAPASNTAFEPISRVTLMGIAVGAGLTYHQLTGDLSNANYSSLKAGLTDQRKFVADAQWHMLAPQVIDRVISRFIDRAILAGRLRDRSGGYPCQVIMPAFEPVDPKKDLEADILAVRAGRMSPQDFLGAWGKDWRTVVEEFRLFFAEIDGSQPLIFDIDARQRTQTGAQITDASQTSPARESTE
ncbi:phage portal protein [Bosea sp. BK604]|uniref:phage portal protein n=1 Tax=Bosea sp. BK604 TaxID=2512180 RepID=UPI00104BA4C8|nr:phage portal protein [Bosea sp. BK604]TCR69700.1 lambda family phage portal protein [Bosea sp. BK604]